MTYSDLDATRAEWTRPPAAPTPPPMSAAAVAALVLGVAGFLLVTVPVGLVLAVVGLVRTSRRRRRGRGLAVAGLVLALVWTAGVGGVVAVLASRTAAPDRDASGHVTKPAQVTPGDLRVGDCVDTSRSGDVTTVPVVPCGTRGGGKVYAIFRMPAGSWPGEPAVATRAEKGCTSRYTRGGQQADTPSDLAYFGPSELGWRLGDRSVVCVVERAR